MRILSAILIISLCTILPPKESDALQSPRPIASDSRIRNLLYKPNEVYIYTGFYQYASSIEFSPDEGIKTLIMGDPTAWQITNQGSRLLLKPIADDATTNMTIYTNKRIYHFELYAKEATGIRDKDMSFIVRFFYPNDAQINASLSRKDFRRPPDIKNFPEKYNFNYSISGSEMIAPRRIFDDGEFTYFEFSKKNPDIPAFFHITPEGKESLINFRINHQYVVVERVSSMFTLRWGNEVICIFNENLPLRPVNAPERKFFGIF